MFLLFVRLRNSHSKRLAAWSRLLFRKQMRLHISGYEESARKSGNYQSIGGNSSSRGTVGVIFAAKKESHVLDKAW
jgi:hypothetical protein